MYPKKASMEGRVALVTGGARGIGGAIARCLSEFGAGVAIADVDAARGRELADELTGEGRQALACTCDVRNQEDVEGAIATVTERLGRIDVLVNNAGGTIRKRFLDMTETEWQAMLELNLIQVFRCTRAVAVRMIEDGMRGSIINVTTVEAYRAAPAYAPYAAAKAGVVNFTKTMALELSPWGIRVNSIAPDATPTEGMWEVLSEVERAEISDSWAHIPRNRRGRAEDFGGAALYLASDLSEWVTGEVIHVGGGTYAASGWRRDEDGFWNNGGPPQAHSGRPLRESAREPGQS